VPLLLQCLLLSPAYLHAAEATSGIQPGRHIPDFSLKDQNGSERNFDSLRGKHGLLILFNRSADWCPFCKAQLVDLEGARKKFEARGVNVIAITYDSPAILSSFAARKSIHFTMLSDPGSKTIDAFGIRNPETTGYEAGVPVPNYYLIDPSGVIRFRHAESGLTDRITANYLYAAIYGSATIPTAPAALPATPHLVVQLAQSDTSVAPGSRIQLTVHAKLKSGEHLYAPGSDKLGYRSIKIVFPSSDLFKANPVQYPKSTELRFAALNETVPVFQKDILLTVDVTPTRSEKTRAHFTAYPDLTVEARLEYQVCTATTCFPPTSLPVAWKIHVAAQDLDTIRAPDEIRWK
jgi:peroxiredoxin